MTAASVSVSSASSWKVSEAASQLHRDALVWDNHAGFGPDPSVDLGMLETWRAAGVDYLSIDVGYDVLTWQQAVKNIAAFITWFEKHPDGFTLVRRAEDILAAKRAGKMAIAFDLEGMNALDGEAYMVSFFYRLGVRQMLFAYNRNNLAGGGCHDEDQGLTDFGRRVIEEMNRVGMMVDCSHTGYRTSMAVLEAASAPAIFSHSNPKALRPHGRNIVDEQIRACARTGGVVGINGIGLFLPDREATTETMVDCLCYVADLVGVDHVGIGLDYAPPMGDDDPLNDLSGFNPSYWPASEGYSDHLHSAAPGQLPEITDRLLGRGWSEPDVRKLLGGNFLRVAQQVWK